MKEERFLSYFIGRGGRVRWREYSSSRPTRWLVILRESFCPPFALFLSPSKGLSPLDFSLSRLSDSSAIRRLYSTPHPGLTPAPSPDGTGLSNRFSSFLSFPFFSFALYASVFTLEVLFIIRGYSGEPRHPGNFRSSPRYLMREAARIYHDAKPTPSPLFPPDPSLPRIAFFATVGPVFVKVH